jgi:hypothetical protein
MSIFSKVTELFSERDWHILEGRKVEAVNFETYLEWLTTRKESEKILIQEHIGQAWISTVFLPLATQITKEPMFETMIFGGKFDQKQYRWQTWDKAIEMHHLIVHMVERSEQPPLHLFMVPFLVWLVLLNL